MSFSYEMLKLSEDIHVHVQYPCRMSYSGVSGETCLQDHRMSMYTSLIILISYAVLRFMDLNLIDLKCFRCQWSRQGVAHKNDIRSRSLYFWSLCIARVQFTYSSHLSSDTLPISSLALTSRAKLSLQNEVEACKVCHWFAGAGKMRVQYNIIRLSTCAKLT